MTAPLAPALLDAFGRATHAVKAELQARSDRTAGHRPGQYELDLRADAAIVGCLVAAGFGVLSEESGGHHTDRAVMVVVDPVDGSTNAAHGIPWFGPSLCAVDDGGLLAAMVTNLGTGACYTAVRGEGAFVDGARLQPSGVTDLADAIVVLNDLPASGRQGWRQFRSLGATALDLAAVAGGTFDAAADCSTGSAPWDYLGGLLLVREAGLHAVDRQGRELVTLDLTARRQVVAGTAELVAAIVAAAW